MLLVHEFAPRRSDVDNESQKFPAATVCTPLDFWREQIEEIGYGIADAFQVCLGRFAKSRIGQFLSIKHAATVREPYAMRNIVPMGCKCGIIYLWFSCGTA